MIFEASAPWHPPQGLGRAVGGEDDLLVALVQGVKGVEELFLGHLLAFQEGLKVK